MLGEEHLHPQTITPHSCALALCNMLCDRTDRRNWTSRLAVVVVLTGKVFFAAAESWRSNLRIFVYNLPKAFNDDLVQRTEEAARAKGSVCDYMQTPCSETGMVPKFAGARQFGGEVVILRKIRASGLVVDDPGLADIFVVPYFAAAECVLGGHHWRCINSVLIQELFAHLKYYGQLTRHRHLFLGTADIHSLPLLIQAQPLLLSLGARWLGHPGHIVVPPMVAEADLQPGAFINSTADVEHRDILLWVAGTPNNLVRMMLFNNIIDVSQGRGAGTLPPGEKGRIIVHVAGRDVQQQKGPPPPAQMVREMTHAQLCPVPPAENSNAGTKRLFDVVLAGCLPIVIAFPTHWGSEVSWWRFNGAPIEWSLPFPNVIDWRRLVIEVPVEALEDSQSVGFLKAALAVPEEIRRAKREYLMEVRQLLLYDFSASAGRDAFSLVMEEIYSAVQLLGVGPRAYVCDMHMRRLSERDFPDEWDHGHNGRQKEWGHTWTEVSVLPVALWRSGKSEVHERGMQDGGVRGTRVQQYKTTKEFSTEDGIRFLLRELDIIQSSSHTQDIETLMTSPFAFCRLIHQSHACHDYMGQHGTFTSLFLCNLQMNPDSPERFDRPWALCRLLPPTVPRSPVTLSSAIGEVERPLEFELVTYLCNISNGVDGDVEDLSSTWGRAWAKVKAETTANPMPRNSQLSIVGYEACALADAPSGGAMAGGKQDDDRGKAKTKRDDGITKLFFQHMLGLIHSAQHGSSGLPDVIMLMPATLSALSSTEWRNPFAMQPWHLLKVAASTMLGPGRLELAGDSERDSRWLVLVASEPADDDEKDGCAQYTNYFNSKCPLPLEFAAMTPILIAFPRAVLLSLRLEEWELAASFPLDTSKLLLTLLHRTVDPGRVFVHQWR
mmetsp:Transcript_48845/g.157734  ORF Transcript_48845/g.157734 Transcript_48845/m.157734 type:complete len:891 (-) Transcript_48845:58-2730(-)